MYSVCAYIMSAIYYLRFYFLKTTDERNLSSTPPTHCIIAYNDVSYDTKTASDAVNLELQHQDGQRRRESQRATTPSRPA